MILDAFRLDGQVALVTGVGSGIGQAITLALAEAGADIVGVYRSHVEETQAQVEALGRRFVPLRADLATARAADCRDLVEHACSALGRLDILVYNAGQVYRGPVLEVPEDAWERVLHVNLTSAFFMCQAAAQHFLADAHTELRRREGRASRGKILVTASMMSFQGGVRVAPYTASKSGLAGVVRAMANELAPLGININAIAPGYIQTPLTAALWQDSERYRAILERIPAGRWGMPEDLKGAAVYLASAASDYCHGTILAVDGGWLCR